MCHHSYIKCKQNFSYDTIETQDVGTTKSNVNPGRIPFGDKIFLSHLAESKCIKSKLVEIKAKKTG